MSALFHKPVHRGTILRGGRFWSGSIRRIYHDTRFSQDKSPYYTHLRIAFWSGGDKKRESPGFSFGLDHKGARLYTGMHIFAGVLLSAYRERVIDRTHVADLEQLPAAVRASGDYDVGGLHYKRVPAGFDRDHVTLRHSTYMPLESPDASRPGW